MNIVGEKEFFEVMKKANNKLNGRERQILCDIVYGLLKSKIRPLKEGDTE